MRLVLLLCLALVLVPVAAPAASAISAQDAICIVEETLEINECREECPYDPGDCAIRRQ